MSNSVRNIQIRRVTHKSHWLYLEVRIELTEKNSEFRVFNESDKYEDEGISGLLNDFMRQFNSEYLKSKIRSGFSQMEDEDSDGNVIELV